MNALDKLFIWLKKRYPSDPTVKLATAELADLRARVEAAERVVDAARELDDKCGWVTDELGDRDYEINGLLLKNLAAALKEGTK